MIRISAGRAYLGDGMQQILYDLHQQTGLSAGTITDDDELATQLGHGGRVIGLLGG
jgi:hypothetical protein